MSSYFFQKERIKRGIVNSYLTTYRRSGYTEDTLLILQVVLQGWMCPDLLMSRPWTKHIYQHPLRWKDPTNGVAGKPAEIV